MRIFTIITGVILAITGIWCFANPGTTFLALAFVLGLVMIFSGISGIFTYITIKKKKEAESWVLAEAILATILGVLVLSNQLATDAMIPVFFGMWILFSGILRVLGAFTLRNKEQYRWVWTLVLGIIGILMGIYCFYNAVIAGFAIVILVGITLMLQGINICATGIQMPHKVRANQKK